MRGGDGTEVIEVGIKKGQEEISRGDGYVHYLDYSDGFPVVYICQKLSDCTLQVSSIYCIIMDNLLSAN